MKKWHWLFVGACLLVSPCAVTFAGNKAGDATFTLGAGYERFATARHIDNTGVKFGALGYNLTEHWGVEGLLGFFVTDSRLPEDNGREVNGTIFALDTVYRFSPYRCVVEPYILFGPGASGLNPNGNDANTQGNINAGAGAQFFFSKTIAFRAEARDFYTIVGGKNDILLDAGVSFLF